MTGDETNTTISGALRNAIGAMWPARASRELLLDLGERKGWSETHYLEAVDAAAE